MFSNKKEQFPGYKSIPHKTKDVSKNAANEKSLLLAFSNDLASVHDKEGLKTIIKRHLKNYFQLSEYIITLKNDDNKTYRYFLHDLPTSDPADEGFKIITSPKMPIEGAMTGAVLQSEKPVVFDIEDLKKGKFSFPSASFWMRAKAKQIRGMRLKVAINDIGIIWTQPGQIEDELLKGISAQISIALSNVFAYEKIAEQLKEIKQYKQQLEQENSYLQEQIEMVYSNELIGNSALMRSVFNLISIVANTNSTVLILGETGTGKELLARSVHNISKRKDKLMIKVNCAALPANLIESELFGHEKGSFTGATERRIGKFELANKGTLFLDEIGEMPLDLQVKLLRAIQEKEIERIGGKEIIKTDVRIVAATNRNLQKEVEEGRFRSDLYYRLNVFPITLPALREHKGDIPLLANHFLEKQKKNKGRNVKQFSSKALQQLISYDWPGNVRELEHVIERSVIINQTATINEIHLPAKKQKKVFADEPVKTVHENEREHILSVLEKCRGKVYGVNGAAELLGLPASTLNSRIKKLGIKKSLQVTSGNTN